ncbi:VC0807 family protein [Limibacter armeniacum]|uniref:VC0807 family protein n=1 Tax=Limibacter armeniacum TaxID=466084 RepID=UPI002FE67DF5
MTSQKTAKKESPFMNLVVNILIPAIILSKFSDEGSLGPEKGLIVALAFPVCYGIYDFATNKKVNFVAILGFISVLLTGAIGLFQLPKEWVAIKEAAVPLLIGLVIIISIFTPYPLVEKMLYNDQLLKVDLINNLLDKNGTRELFRKKLVVTSWLLGLSFFLSAILNFVLAEVLIKSEPGSVAFNEELGQMTALSWPVIVLPAMLVMALALWYLVKSIKLCTGLGMQEVLQGVEESES